MYYRQIWTGGKLGLTVELHWEAKTLTNKGCLPFLISQVGAGGHMSFWQHKLCCFSYQQHIPAPVWRKQHMNHAICHSYGYYENGCTRVGHSLTHITPFCILTLPESNPVTQLKVQAQHLLRIPCSAVVEGKTDKPDVVWGFGSASRVANGCINCIQIICGFFTSKSKQKVFWWTDVFRSSDFTMLLRLIVRSWRSEG